MIITKARVGLILPALDRQAIRNERIFLISLRRWMAFVSNQIRQDLTTKFIKADVTADLTDWEFIQQNGEEILKPATLNIMQSGGKEAYRIFKVQAAFDILNTHAVGVADKVTAKLVREVTGKTREGIRHYIKEGIKAGKGMPKIARELRPLVGLTKNQVQSVSNYKSWLTENRPELSAEQLGKKVTGYTNKTQRRRAMTIARTETARAQNTGYAIGLGDLGVEKVEFQIHPDERTCPECEDLNEQIFPVEEGQEIIPVHPNCRCALLPVVGKTPTCQQRGGVRKAECTLPDDLHDEQIKDLLKRLKSPKTPAEGRKIRKALRKLGHKGGLKGQPAITVKPPKARATKLVVPEPRKVKPKPIVPKPAEKLFEAANIGKAEANARRILGIPITDVKARKAFSFKGVDVEAANHINRGLHNFKQKFPQVKLDAIEVGGKGKNIYAEIAMDYKAGKTTLILDGNSFRNYKTLSKTAKRNGKTNYLVGDSVEDLIAHEMGHALNYQHLRATFGNKARMEVDRLKTIKFSQKGLSKYATSDGVEGLAEIFSKYVKTGSLKGISTARGGGIDSIKRILKTWAGVEL